MVTRLKPAAELDMEMENLERERLEAESEEEEEMLEAESKEEELSISRFGRDILRRIEMLEGESSSEAKSSLEAVYGSSLESSVSLEAECMQSWKWNGGKLCLVDDCGKHAEMRVSCRDKNCSGCGWRYFCRFHLRGWKCSVCCDDGCSESASVQESEEEEVITQFLQSETTANQLSWSVDSETGEQFISGCGNNLSGRPMVDSGAFTSCCPEDYAREVPIEESPKLNLKSVLGEDLA